MFRRSTLWMGATAALALCSGVLQPATGAPDGRIIVAQVDKPSGQGKVNSVDAAARMVNMSHGPVAALKWPGMTMDFPVAPGVDMSALKPGEKVGFTLSKGADGAYMIDSIKPAP